MDDQKKKQFKPHPGHSMPITRREMLAQGLIGGAGMMLVPSALTYLLGIENANAQAALNCPTLGPAAGLIPFLSIDCAGGAGLSGNLVVGSQQSGALVPLSSYSTLGLPYSPTATAGSMDNRFGSSFHVGPSPTDSTKPISRIFEGMTANMSEATQANTRIVTICHTSQDDTSDNELTPNIALTQAGLRGRLIQNGIGTNNSLSGGNSASALTDASYRPMFASSIRSVTGALSYGTILSAYPAAYREKLANAISNLSQSQATRFSQLSLADQFQTLVNCGYITNKNYATTTPDIDPRTNAAMQAVYGLTATQVDNRSRNAAIVYNTLLGNSGPGVITIGGCDYHGEAQPGVAGHGDFKDLEIGNEIGRAVEAAARLAKPLFIAVYSDGSVYSQDNTRVWNGDAGSKSLAFMVYYRPTGAPTIRKQQIGYYNTSGQSANTAAFWTKNTKFTSYVMIANYLNVCGQRSLFSSIAPSGFDTSTATIDSILGFG